MNDFLVTVSCIAAVIFAPMIYFGGKELVKMWKEMFKDLFNY